MGKSAEHDVYLDRGIDKLSRDLDIVNLLKLIKGYHVMKQVLFSHQDRFFLQLQRRDIIYSSSSEEQSEQELVIRNQSTRKLDLRGTDERL